MGMDSKKIICRCFEDCPSSCSSVWWITPGPTFGQGWEFNDAMSSIWRWWGKGKCVAKRSEKNGPPDDEVRVFCCVWRVWTMVGGGCWWRTVCLLSILADIFLRGHGVFRDRLWLGAVKRIRRARTRIQNEDHVVVGAEFGPFTLIGAIYSFEGAAQGCVLIKCYLAYSAGHG